MVEFLAGLAASVASSLIAAAVVEGMRKAQALRKGDDQSDD